MILFLEIHLSLLHYFLTLIYLAIIDVNCGMNLWIIDHRKSIDIINFELIPYMYFNSNENLKEVIANFMLNGE